MKPLSVMQAEGKAYSQAAGWYDVPRTWGEDIALLHSEVSEALDAYRQWGLEDKTLELCTLDDHTEHLCKPEGVGSEFADVLIRLLDACERHNIDIDGKYHLVKNSRTLSLCSVQPKSPFGDMIAHLHGRIHQFYMWRNPVEAVYVYEVLKSICFECSIDLGAEYERKYRFNLTRPYRHGNKRL